MAAAVAEALEPLLDFSLDAGFSLDPDFSLEDELGLDSLGEDPLLALDFLPDSRLSVR